ncbi:MAG TPA: asparaginase [Pyrinomonadaceae bacterium]|nr:asparaginase [Pyrinomonadaceae bacterium]
MKESEDGRDYQTPEPLVLVTRGSFVESIHAGHLAAVDGDGRVVASLGSPDAVSFMRSATKPFQALPLVTTGAADRFRLDARELAVACGSHNGEAVHTEAVLSMLSKTGLSVSDLKCGAHEPYSHEADAALRERGEKPTALHNNCSGKHAGMLALALHLGSNTSEYDRPDGPVQRAVFRAVSHFSGVGESELRFGTDGCGVPTFALTARTMALMFARFVAGAEEVEDVTHGAPRGVVGADAARRIIDAVLVHPDMVEGDGELDTELMRAGRGRFISKVGAEGVYCAGVLPCERWPRGLGLAFKIEDGDKSDRARPLVAVEALRQLRVLADGDLTSLSKFTRSALKNHRGDAVGEARPSFTL